MPEGLSGQGTLGDLAEEFERIALKSPNRARLRYATQTASIVVFRVFSGSGADGSTSDSDLLMDIRWSLRSVLKHPGFSFGVVAVLGLGLGANAAVFSVVDGTLRNTSWWEHPNATVAVWPDAGFSFGQLGLYSEEQAVYRAVGGYNELAFAVQTSDGESQSVNGVLITPELFRQLAVQPNLGRALVDEDAAFGVEPVVVIGNALWRRSFGADPAILGRRITISGAPVTVVGVQGESGMAPGGRAELWFPLTMDPRDDDYWRAATNTLVGVLRDDADLGDAFGDLIAFTETLSRMFPMFYPPGYADGSAYVTRADESQRRMISTPLLLLLGATGLLMLVTALNVGSLLLGRAIHRRKELSVRTAIGAGKGRIVRQLLVEGFVLTVLALCVGLVTGSVAGDWIATLFVGETVVGSASVLSPPVLAFSLAVATLAWLVLNGIPIAHFLRTQRAHTPRGERHDSPGSGAGMQRALVTVQAALATLLLVSATLLVVTVDNLRAVPLGFEPSGLVTLELSPPEDRVDSVEEARDLYSRLVDAVEALPGAQSAGLTGWLPLRADAPPTPINLQAAPIDPAQALYVPMHMVDAGFFESFGISPSRGRLLGSEDRAPSPSAVVINEALARTLWPNENAVGQMIAIDPHDWEKWLPVVGVIPDIRSGGITGPIGPALYVSLAESPSRDVTLVVRAETGLSGFIPLLQRTVGGVDALVPIRGISTMDDVVRTAYATSWVMMGLLIALAALATGLGATGIYAVLAHHVTLNRREIGVRMALGAEPGVVIRGVVRSGLALASLGIAIGCIAAVLSTRLLESLLFEVSPLAPWAFIAPAVALAAAAAIAAWVPASRAGRLPPAEVLRSD